MERLTGSKRHGDDVAAVIVESGLEAVYLMEGRFGRGNLARFVSKFHSDPGSLRQLKRSFGERPREGAVKEEDDEVKLGLQTDFSGHQWQLLSGQ